MTPGTTMPNFLIAGAMRSGTTSMTRWLDWHPDVFMATPKEVHFFDRNYDRGPGWYSRHFEEAATERAIGEATPNYLYDELALLRISADLPDIRVVVLLRDPIERAYSHYQHRAARGGEELPFEDAIAAEPERLARGGLDRAHYSYVDRGRYLGQLRRLLDSFSRDAVSVQLFEDLRDNPTETFRRTARFLDIDDSHVPEGVGRQVNGYQTFRSHALRRWSHRLPASAGRVLGRLNRVEADGYEPMSSAARSRLLEVYGPERDELARLTGYDLSVWQG